MRVRATRLSVPGRIDSGIGNGGARMCIRLNGRFRKRHLRLRARLRGAFVALRGPPSVTYACSGSATPADVSTSITCATIWDWGWGLKKYCCAAPDTCFAGEREVEAPGCGAYDVELCTGSAPPTLSDKTCTATATDAGAGIRGYCCAASTADGGYEGGDGGDGG